MSISSDPPVAIGNGPSAWLGGSEMAAELIARDWSGTPLGPIRTWPQSLRSALAICLHSRFQMAIYWGPELVCFYNDAERAVLGDLHPGALGMPARELLTDAWEVVGPELDTVMQTGEATWAEDQPLVVDRNGAPEVAYFTYSYSAIPGDRSEIGGVLLVTQETTARVRAERRLESLRRLGAESLDAATPLQACRLATRALAPQADVEFALVYLCSDDGHRATCVAADDRYGELEPRHPSVELDEPGVLRAVVESGSASTPVRADRLISPCTGRAMAPGMAVVAPIRRGVAAPLAGFLVLGADRALARDDVFRRFAEMVGEEIGHSLVAARTREVERERERQQLLRELRAAQRRAAAAGDAERQRIESNLHDGAQQRLMAIRLELGLLGETLERDPSAARAELDRLRGELDDALEELRELAHGLYPPLLATDGLAAAVSAAARRATTPVQVEMIAFPRLPRAIENAAYFCCLEALQNVAKHAGQCARATVSLVVADATLQFRVTDDGAGFDRHAVPAGHGLTNLADRLQALGGSAEISSRPGAGTIVTGWIPLTVPDDQPPD